MSGGFLRGLGLCLLIWVPFSCHAADCSVGVAGECTDDGCCTDDKQAVWDLSVLGGDKSIPGPEGPDSYDYKFNLLGNLETIPAGCYEMEPPVAATNALRYDENANATKGNKICEEIGCNMQDHKSWEGLKVKSDPGRGLIFEYKNDDLGDSYLVVNLVCQRNLVSAGDPEGKGFPENLHQEGPDKQWRLTWNTALVCRGSDPSVHPPGPPQPPNGGGGWAVVVVIVLVLAVLGAGGFALWKRGLAPCKPSSATSSPLGEHLDAQLDAEASGKSIGGAE